MVIGVFVLIICWICYEAWKHALEAENRRSTTANDRLRVQTLLEESEERQKRPIRKDAEVKSTSATDGEQAVEKVREVVALSIIEKSSPVSADVPIDVDAYTEWFITDWGEKSIPSSAEQKIIDELGKWDIEWYREVSFRPFMTPAGGHYRYDFYIPSICTCLEYHGWEYHNTPEQKAIDVLKEVFCKKNNIQLVVYKERSDYYNMYGHIHTLMRRHGVKKKIWNKS